tara:strand:- start:81 stop:1781 length:1701 start_codon:yes stop_codon:yes gene_type:complete
MRKILNQSKFILFVTLFIIIFFNIHVKSLEKTIKGDNISDYFSGILSLNKNEYYLTYRYLKNIEGLEDAHYTYSQVYLYSLINLNKFREAYIYSKKLERKKLNSFESDLLIGLYNLKNKNNFQAKKNLKKNFQKKDLDPLQRIISIITYNFSDIQNLSYDQSFEKINLINNRFDNIKKIQKIFLNCYYNSPETENSFKKIVEDKSVNFLRYNFFYANYLISNNQIKNAQKVIKSSLKVSPRNLLIDQLRLDLIENKGFKNNFDCSNESHILSEFFYVVSNALSSQGFYSISNFYLSLSKFLNPDFISHDVLYAENSILIGNIDLAKNLYKKLKKFGDAFNWFASKELTNILVDEGKKEEAIKILRKSYGELKNSDNYQKIEFADYLKNNKQYIESIKYYTEVIESIDLKHDLYPQATDGRGIAYERTGSWSKAEKDFLNSLEAKPNQAYVLNYLAYSWIEQNANIERSLVMLKKANELRKNDPYIIDSLGWALFKLKNFQEAEKYLQKAVRLLPSDPIVNDHFADILWFNNKKIQARYYWNYVLNLDDTKKDMRTKINKKIISGLN